MSKDQLLIQKKEFGQVFITDTHENRVAQIVEKFDMNYEKFVIENGKHLDDEWWRLGIA